MYMLKVHRKCHKAPKKHHTIPADVLPNDSADNVSNSPLSYATVSIQRYEKPPLAKDSFISINIKICAQFYLSSILF